MLWEDSVFYELHVRAFTMHESSGCCHKGTFAGIIEKLDDIKELGVTAIVLMPSYEFEEKEYSFDQDGKRKVSYNYWGYKKGYYYIPKTSYAASNDPKKEFQQLVEVCHQNGLELFMQFYFPNDMENKEIAQVLEYWNTVYRVDGFQIMSSCCIDKIRNASDCLKQVKLIAECAESSLDAANTAVYRPDQKTIYRRFLKGDEGSLSTFLQHFCTKDLHENKICSVADHNGMRIADVVSYNQKQNADGIEENDSWNCGVEGICTEYGIQTLRKRQIKNALSFLLLGWNTPYLFMGDEFASTQYGNNNPYDQDNEIFWLDWNKKEEQKDIYEFTKRFIAFRKEHSYLYQSVPVERDMKGYGYPNISFHGKEAYQFAAGENIKEVGILLCENQKLTYFAFNMHWIPKTLALPIVKGKSEWKCCFDTNTDTPYELSKDSKFLTLAPRSVAVLEAVLEPNQRQKDITAF